MDFSLIPVSTASWIKVLMTHAYFVGKFPVVKRRSGRNMMTARGLSVFRLLVLHRKIACCILYKALSV